MSKTPAELSAGESPSSPSFVIPEIIFHNAPVEPVDVEDEKANHASSSSTPPLTPSSAAQLQKLLALKGELPTDDLPPKYFETDFTERIPPVSREAFTIRSKITNLKRQAEAHFGASITFVTGPPKVENPNTFTRGIEVAGWYINNLWHKDVKGFFFPTYLPILDTSITRHHLLEKSEKNESHGLVEYNTAIGKRLLLPPKFHDTVHRGIFLLKGVQGLDHPVLVFSKDFTPLKHPKDFVIWPKPADELTLLKFAVQRAQGAPLDLQFYQLKEEYNGISKQLDDLIAEIKGTTFIGVDGRLLTKHEYVEEAYHLSIQFAETPEQAARVQSVFQHLMPFSQLNGSLLEACLKMLSKSNHVSKEKRYLKKEDFKDSEDHETIIKLTHQGRPVTAKGAFSEKEVTVGPQEVLFIDGQNEVLGPGLEMVTPFVRNKEVTVRRFHGLVNAVTTSVRSIAPKVLSSSRGQNKRGRYWRENLTIEAFAMESFWFETNSQAKGLISLVRCLNNHIFADSLFGRVNPLGLGVIRCDAQRRWNIAMLDGCEFFDSHTFITNSKFLKPMFQTANPSDAGPDSLIPPGVLESLSDERVRFNVLEHILDGVELEATVTIGSESFNDFITDDFRVRPVEETRVADVFLRWNNEEKANRPPPTTPPMSSNAAPINNIPPLHPTSNTSFLPSSYSNFSSSSAASSSTSSQPYSYSGASQRGRSRSRGRGGGTPPQATAFTPSSSSAVTASYMAAATAAAAAAMQAAATTPVQLPPPDPQNAYFDWLKYSNQPWQEKMRSGAVNPVEVYYFFSRAADCASEGGAFGSVISKLDRCLQTVKKIPELKARPWYQQPIAGYKVPESLRPKPQ